MAHQHYKGTGKMHSFKGLLADGAQERIRIQGATGEIAWRITKFQIMMKTPGTGGGTESIVKIYREEQTTVDGVIDFGNDELLGAAYISEQDNAQYPPGIVIVFDNALFSRNIWITHNDIDGSHNINYYMELEEVKVSAAGMAQLAVAAARRVS